MFLQVGVLFPCAQFPSLNPSPTEPPGSNHSKQLNLHSPISRFIPIREHSYQFGGRGWVEREKKVGGRYRKEIELLGENKKDKINHLRLRKCQNSKTIFLNKYLMLVWSLAWCQWNTSSCLVSLQIGHSFQSDWACFLLLITAWKIWRWASQSVDYI